MNLTKQQITEFQQSLVAAGYDCNTNGILSARTIFAYQQYCSNKGIKVESLFDKLPKIE